MVLYQPNILQNDTFQPKVDTWCETWARLDTHEADMLEVREENRLMFLL